MEQKDILKRFGVLDEELKGVCARHGIKALFLFGSVLTEDFQLGKSDLDFLVEFEHPSFDVYFDFLEALKGLFKYEKIDLITVASLKNKVIREEILNSRKSLYAA